MRYVFHRLLTAAALAVALVCFSAPDVAAEACDLYQTTSTCLYDGSAGTAIFQVVNPQPTGTGVIDSFLRVQMKGYEEGFNTDARPALCDNVDCDIKTDPNYTRDLTVAEVPIVEIGGVEYREFFLDINEPTADPKQYITLDQIEIYLSNTAGLNSYSSTSGLTGATKIWDLDTVMPPSGPSGDNWINLNYGLLGGGSGTGDMVMYIPNALFGSQTYVYLYSQFGCISKGKDKTCGTYGDGTKYSAPFASQAGFEEWWVYNYQNGGGGGGGASPVPEPGTLTLLATGMAFAASRYRRNKPAAQ